MASVGTTRTVRAGFVPDAAEETVYARPVRVAVAPDGSLSVAEDANDVIGRVSFAGRPG
jgi:glucose/arabinose dehydrogenase